MAMVQTLSGATRSLGTMKFTVANGALLVFGGASQTAPTSQVSVGSGSGILVAAIPQTGDKTRFLETSDDSTLGHNAKHLNIRIGLPGTTGSGGPVNRAHGVAPTATLGFPHAYGEDIYIVNNRAEIFNLQLFNATGGSVDFYVEVLE